MLVSIAVLSVALVVIGFVFAATVKTTRQAAAYSEANNWVRQFLDQLDQDLKYCEPSQSVLVLVGRTQAAALTQDKLNAGRFYRVLTGNPAAPGLAGYNPETNPNLDNTSPGPQYSNPRADILMFFTNRQMASQSPPHNLNYSNNNADLFGKACENGARFAPIEVVYGQAAFNDPEFNAATGQFQWPANEDNARHIEDVGGGATNRDKLSSIPADQWHLARRAMIPQTYYRNTGPLLPTDIKLPANVCLNLARCTPYVDPTTGEHMPGDGAYFNLPLFLEQLGPLSTYPPANVAQWLRPYNYPGGPGWDTSGNIEQAITSLLYGTGTVRPKWHDIATVIDNPPAELQSNLGVHMLPSCAWFQVEFLMPEDPRNSLEYAPNPNVVPPISQRPDMPRWTEVNANPNNPDPNNRATTYVFAPDTQANRDALVFIRDSKGNQSLSVDGSGNVRENDTRLGSFARLVPPAQGGLNNVSNRRLRMWPYAIRVTVRVFDPEGRLPQPIIRSLVHRFD